MTKEDEETRNTEETESCLNLVFPSLDESLQLYTDYNSTRGLLNLSYIKLELRREVVFPLVILD